jgi:hypothetical protein
MGAWSDADYVRVLAEFANLHERIRLFEPVRHVDSPDVANSSV